MLDELGFVWSLRNSPAKRVEWDERRDQLKAYKEKNGDCLVSYNYDEDPPLAKWVEKQRNMYKRKTDGKLSQLTDERVAKLQELDFVWSLRERNGRVLPFDSSSKRRAASKTGGARKKVKTEMVEAPMPPLPTLKGSPLAPEESDREFRAKVKEYVEKMNDSELPEELRQWVELQKDQQRLFVANKESNLTEDRIFKLNEVGILSSPLVLSKGSRRRKKLNI
jgi:hypothetical protein